MNNSIFAQILYTDILSAPPSGAYSAHKHPFGALFSTPAIFTNPSARAECDTRSIFKRSLTDLNSEFSFS